MSRIYDALSKSEDLFIGAEEKGTPKNQNPVMLRTDPEKVELESTVRKTIPIEVSSNGYKHVHARLTPKSRLAYYMEPHGLVAEQFRFLRRSLNQDLPNGGILVISSPAAADGKTLTAVNLATCLSDSGNTTLIADMDTRKPALQSAIGCLRTQHGIEEALAKRVQPRDVVQFVEELKLYAAFVSAVPADPSTLISGVGVATFLGWARESFHWIVLDTPPVMPVGDVSELLPLVDAVLLVVRARKTPRDLSKRVFELIGNQLYGVIMNDAESEASAYYRHFSRYYQGTATNVRNTK